MWTLKVIFFIVSFCKNQYKFRNTAFLFVTIKIWITHYNKAKKITLNLVIP